MINARQRKRRRPRRCEDAESLGKPRSTEVKVTGCRGANKLRDKLTKFIIDNQSLGQAFLKACSFQRQSLWSLSAESETLFVAAKADTNTPYFLKSGGECHRFNLIYLYSLVKLTDLPHSLYDGGNISTTTAYFCKQIMH